MNKKIIIGFLVLCIVASSVFAACPPTLSSKLQALSEIKSIISPIFAYNPEQEYPNIEILLPLVLDLTEAYLSAPDETAWQSTCNSIGKRSKKILDQALSDAKALPVGNISVSNCGGIFHGTCNSADKPKYCDNGVLIDKCELCGCPLTMMCSAGSCVPISDSCSDSDGGDFPNIFGTASGYLGGSGYSLNDNCLNATHQWEYNCVGDFSSFSVNVCGSSCVGGVCI